MPAKGDLAPIVIGAGAMGNARDLIVSPQHRILVSGWWAELYMGEREVLVAAKHLVNNRTVQSVPMLGVTYIHAMCAGHEMVLANGCWCELFQPADSSLNGLGNAQRNELGEIFPALSPNYKLYGPQPTGPIH